MPETRTAATTNDTTHSKRKNPAYLELIKCMCWPANSCIPHFSRDQLTSHKIGTTCETLSSVTCFFMPYSTKKGMAISAITFYMLRGMQETNFCSNMCPPPIIINPSNPVPPIGRPHSAQIIPTNHHSSPAENTPPNQERTPIPIILLKVIKNTVDTAFKSCMIGTVRNQTRILKSCIIGIAWPCKTAWCDSERTERENAAQIGAAIGINTIFYFIIPLW